MAEQAKTAAEFQKKHLAWLAQEQPKVKFKLYLNDADCKDAYDLCTKAVPGSTPKNLSTYEERFWVYYDMAKKLRDKYYNQKIENAYIFQIVYFDWLKEQVQKYAGNNVQWFIDNIDPFYFAACTKVGVTPINGISYSEKFWIYSHIARTLITNPTAFTQPEEKTNLNKVISDVLGGGNGTGGGIFGGITDMLSFIPWAVGGFVAWKIFSK